MLLLNKRSIHYHLKHKDIGLYFHIHIIQVSRRTMLGTTCLVLYVFKAPLCYVAYRG